MSFPDSDVAAEQEDSDLGEEEEDEDDEEENGDPSLADVYNDISDDNSDYVEEADGEQEDSDLDEEEDEEESEIKFGSCDRRLCDLILPPGGFCSVTFQQHRRPEAPRESMKTRTMTMRAKHIQT